MFKYLLYKIGQFLVNIFPLQLSYTLAKFLCDCQYFFSFRDRRSVQRNLRIICGEGVDIPALSREVFRNFGMYLVEFFYMEKMVTKEFLKERVIIEHLDRLEKLKEQKTGVVLLTAHLGNWELGGILMGLLGYPMTIIALPHQERPVNNFFNHKRTLTGHRVIKTSQAIRTCTEVLDQKGWIALVADRDFSHSGEIIDFLGKKARLPKGAALFSLRLGVPLVPSFFIREASGKFRLIFEEPIYPDEALKQGNEEQQVHFLMRTYLRIIEDKIRLYPAQWIVFREFACT